MFLNDFLQVVSQQKEFISLVLTLGLTLAGINAKGLDPNLDCHHLVVNDWKDLEAQQNVCIISMPTVFDSSLAPPGKATIHAYVAANEPYDIWQGLDRKSEEYRKLKVCRSNPASSIWCMLSSCDSAILSEGLCSQ